MLATFILLGESWGESDCLHLDRHSMQMRQKHLKLCLAHSWKSSHKLECNIIFHRFPISVSDCQQQEKKPQRYQAEVVDVPRCLCLTGSCWRPGGSGICAFRSECGLGLWACTGHCGLAPLVIGYLLFTLMQSLSSFAAGSNGMLCTQCPFWAGTRAKVCFFYPPSLGHMTHSRSPFCRLLAETRNKSGSALALSLQNPSLT